MNNIMVIAVHPDDETLGCGGTLLKHKSNNDKIHWVICTQTETNTQFYKQRENEIKQVADLFKFDSVTKLELQTTRIDEYSTTEIVNKLADVIKNIEPSIIYLPFKNDVHSDHRIIFDATFSCTKSFRYSFIKKIYMMETLSETEFAPNFQTENFCPNSFNDITEFFEKKCNILQVYESEMGTHPFPRSLETVKALAMLRGSTANCQFAESFMLIKEIN